jgi:FlaA1/EpsC-like NDP-sugar epimerase
MSHFAGKTVLVTGAGGSIGSEICRELAEQGVKQLRLLGHSEQPIYEIERDLRENLGYSYMHYGIQTIIGSVGDPKIAQRACAGVDIVIHAAAHKHVPLCEQNPLEAIQNNVGGTVNLVNAAKMAGVEQFVMVSTDKAVKPSSVMGATKRACELYVAFMASRSTMKFTTVRFGNVLDSAGSVLPLWREQIARGGPVTVTDKRCTRFFMSIPEAVNLTLAAASLPRCDGLFVLDMGAPKRIYDLAAEVLEAAGKRKIPGSMPDDFIVETGLRPGEKLHEELSYGGELVTTSVPKVLAVRESAGRVTRWNDFNDLLMAVQTDSREVALKKLWEIVS